MLYVFILIANVAAARHLPLFCPSRLCNLTRPVTATITPLEAGGSQAATFAQGLRLTEPTNLSTPTQNTMDDDDDGDVSAPETKSPPARDDGVNGPDGDCVAQSFCVQWLTCGKRGGP